MAPPSGDVGAHHAARRWRGGGQRSGPQRAAGRALAIRLEGLDGRWRCTALPLPDDRPRAGLLLRISAVAAFCTSSRIRRALSVARCAAVGIVGEWVVSVRHGLRLHLNVALGGQGGYCRCPAARSPQTLRQENVDILLRRYLLRCGQFGLHGRNFLFGVDLRQGVEVESAALGLTRCLGKRRRDLG